MLFQDVALPTTNVKELEKLIMVNDDCSSLEEYLRGFEITLRIMQNTRTANGN